MDSVLGNGSKTLEELKAERTGANWSWKQKTNADLHVSNSTSSYPDQKDADEKESQNNHLSQVDRKLSKLKVP